MDDRLAAVLLTFLVVGGIVVGPVFTILALNTLFGFAIPINFGTWLASLWLTAAVYGASGK